MKALTLEQQKAAVAAGVVLLAIAAWFLLVAPKQREVTLLKTQIRHETVRIGQGPPPAPAAISEVERTLWTELETRLRERYPAESDLPKAMAAVSGIARASGLTPVNIELITVIPPAPGAPAVAVIPGAPPVQVFHAPPPLTVNATMIKLVAEKHRYRDLVRFVERLASAPVYVAVRALEIRRTDNELTTEIILSSFRWTR